MTIVTNLLIFIFSIICFKNLTKYTHLYPRSWAWFVLLVGISSCFGSTAHAVHLQAGKLFFDIVFYIMNALSLASIYFCFRGPYVLYTHGKKEPNKNVMYLVIAWIAALLTFTLFKNNFLIVKINAGIVLLYSFIVHLMVYNRTKEEGSKFVTIGISITFIPIIIHSLKFSIHEWFNYKDISHVIIFIALLVIYKGVKITSGKLNSVSQH